MANFESVEDGAIAHGINIDELMKALNAKTGESTSSGCGCGCGGGDCDGGG